MSSPLSKTKTKTTWAVQHLKNISFPAQAFAPAHLPRSEPGQKGCWEIPKTFPLCYGYFYPRLDHLCSLIEIILSSACLILSFVGVLFPPCAFCLCVCSSVSLSWGVEHAAFQLLVSLPTGMLNLFPTVLPISPISCTNAVSSAGNSLSWTQVLCDEY